jgi:hypothetical protein
MAREKRVLRRNHICLNVSTNSFGCPQANSTISPVGLPAVIVTLFSARFLGLLLIEDR